MAQEAGIGWLRVEGVGSRSERQTQNICLSNEADGRTEVVYLHQVWRADRRTERKQFSCNDASLMVSINI